MTGIIYCITNTVNSKRYVGQTTMLLADRWAYHLYATGHSSKQAIHCAIRKYGERTFILAQLDVANSREELNQKEKDYIAQFRSLAPDGYNLTIGGEGHDVSKETRLVLSVAAKGKVRGHLSEETKQRISGSLIGHEVSTEARKKMSETLGGRLPSNETRKKLSLASSIAWDRRRSSHG